MQFQNALLFGFVAFGSDDLYHRGALFSALRIRAYSGSQQIAILTDRPELFEPYPIETIRISPPQMREWSFGGRYLFGIKAAGIIQILKRTDTLIFMDADVYPTRDLVATSERITPKQSIMRYCEGTPDDCYRVLEGRGFRVGENILTGREPMWNSGFVGVHRDNLPALEAAYMAIEPLIDVVTAHTPEQYCLGVALASEGRRIIKATGVRHYNSSGKKSHVRERLDVFFEKYGRMPIEEQIEAAGRFRLWRSPWAIFKQRVIQRRFKAARQANNWRSMSQTALRDLSQD